MLEIIANGSNTYPYQKSTLSDLYRLLETYTLDPVFERYGEFVNRTPCWIDGETARKYSGASVIAGNFLSYSHAFYLITDQEELIRSLERLIEKNRASPNTRPPGRAGSLLMTGRNPIANNKPERMNLMEFKDFQYLTHGDPVTFLLAWNMLLENGRVSLREHDVSDLAAGLQVRMSNFMTEERPAAWRKPPKGSRSWSPA